MKLTSHEFRVLSYLMHHRGRVVSQTELSEHIYAQDFDRDSNTVEVFIARLRRKLGASLDRDRARAGLPHRGGGADGHRSRCAAGCWLAPVLWTVGLLGDPRAVDASMLHFRELRSTRVMHGQPRIRTRLGVHRRRRAAGRRVRPGTLRPVSR